jgi:hypothetical protein
MTLMTLIASESDFSTSGCVLSDFCSSLHANTLKALVCGQDWIRQDEGLDLADEANDKVSVTS